MCLVCQAANQIAMYVSCRSGSQSERALCMFLVGQAANQRELCVCLL